MTVPPEVSGFMPMVSPWYTIDEDDMRTESAAARATSTQGVTAAAQGETAVRGAGQHYGGESGTALQAHWDRTGLSGGHLDQAANASRLAPVGLEGAANVVSGVKVATIVQAAHASVDVARLLALGAAAGGTAFAVRRILMARAANRKIRKEGSTSRSTSARRGAGVSSFGDNGALDMFTGLYAGYRQATMSTRGALSTVTQDTGGGIKYPGAAWV